MFHGGLNKISSDDRLQLGRLFVDLADNDPGVKHRPIVAKQLKPGDCCVDDKPIGRQIPRQPAQALEIDRDLTRPSQRVGHAHLSAMTMTPMPDPRPPDAASAR